MSTVYHLPLPLKKMNRNLLFHLALFLLVFACSPKTNTSKSADQAPSLPGKKPLIILNGTRLPANQSLAHISPEDVELVEVIEYSKDNKRYLNRTYGPAAKEGVVKITTKNAAQDIEMALHAKLTKEITAFEREPTAYLFVMNGILVTANEVSKLKQLEPSELTAVEVLRTKTAKAIYGDEARENTVIINTRSRHSK